MVSERKSYFGKPLIVVPFLVFFLCLVVIMVCLAILIYKIDIISPESVPGILIINAVVMIGALIVLFPSLIALWDRGLHSAQNTLRVGEKLLSAQAKGSGSVISPRSLVGSYKGRQVVFTSFAVKWSFFHEIAIVPQSVPRKQKSVFMRFILLQKHLPHPTENTVLDGRSIRYVDPPLKEAQEWWSWEKMFPKRSEQDMINILEHLTKAAEIVEADAPYYKD